MNRLYALLCGLVLVPAPRAHAQPAETPAAERVANPDPEQPATSRERYNRGVEALAAGDLEEAERWLGGARGA